MFGALRNASALKDMRTLHVISILLVLDVLSARPGQELLINGDLEGTLGDWFCLGGCTVSPSSDAYQNAGSAMITGRTKKWMGLGQRVQDMSDAAHYELTAYIKLLDLMSGALYDTADMIMKCKDKNAADSYVYTKFGSVPQIRLQMWTKIGGSNYVRAGLHSCVAYVAVEGPSVNYIIDVVSLKEIRESKNWRAKAEKRINKIRKGTIVLSLVGGNLENYTIEIEQKKHTFAFGSVVGASEMVDPSYKNYQEFFYNNFEWGVLGNALKWTGMEWSRDKINYERPQLAMDALQNRSILIRGHNVVWGVEKHVPSWLKTLNTTVIGTELNERIADVVNFTKGVVEHWDVNNEVLHGDWFEQTLSDANITMSMFKQCRAVDSQVKLFLNEYGVLESHLAMAIRNQALLYKAAGVPVDAVGLQSHITPADVDITLLTKRLDTVGESKLPIWITELSMDEPNATVKAKALVDVMTLYFSYPKVQGIILWGFWDGRIWKPDSKLFEGPDITPNEAGTAFLELMEQWRTYETVTLSPGQQTSFRGFKGQYTITITRGDTVVKTIDFSLKKRKRIKIKLDN